MIGERIREIRLEKKLKAARIAEQVGISKYAFSNIENGKCRVKADMIIPLANALDCDPMELLEHPEPVATE